eukprot:gene7120-8493_t
MCLPFRDKAVGRLTHSVRILLNRFPLGDAKVYDKLRAHGGVLHRFENARRAYEACAGAPHPAGAHGLGLLEACSELDALLASSGGPFIQGAEMTAADCLLLPLLERTEAVVPYFFGEDALQRCQFGRVQKMLKAARSSTVFGDLASDATTLARTNVEYASPLFRPEPVAAARIDATDPEL